MAIAGAEGMTVAELRQELARGAKIVVFPYTISLLVVTLRRSSDPILIRPGHPSPRGAWGYILLSLLLGWWGFPFGLIFTPAAIIECLAGGKDVTARVLQAIGGEPAPPPPAFQQQPAWHQQQQRAWQQQQAWQQGPYQQGAPPQQGAAPLGWSPASPPPRDKS